jgi:Tol biopolymer transport system component
MGLTGGERGKIARLISSTRDEFQPAYSPEGQKIAFESDRSGCEEIWVCNADGSAPFHVTNFGTGWSGSPRWSPGGQYIAFDRAEGGPRYAVYVVNSQGGKPIRLTTNQGNQIIPNWSRDARWIYFASDRAGRFEVWKIQPTGGPEIQVTKNGGTMPLESLDGNFLYYSRAGGPRNVALWKMPVAGGQETKVLDRLLFPRAYAVAKHGIYFLEGAGTSSAPYGDSRDPAPRLRFYDFKTRQITTIGSTQGHNLAGRITVSPDERWMLYGHDDGNGSDLMLVENFP